MEELMARGKSSRVSQFRSQGQSQRQTTGLFTGAVHIGASEISVGVVNESHQVLIQARYVFSGTPAHRDRWSKIPAILERLARDERIRISAIGITFSRNSDEPRRNGSDQFSIRQRDKLTGKLSGKFHVPVATADDIEGVLLAEAKWGTQRGKSQLMFIEIAKSGCAAALIATKYVDGSPDPFGVTPVQRFKPWGFWESSVSEASVVQHFKECAGPRYKNRNIGTREIWDLALRGNSSAQSAFVSEAIYFARGLAELIHEHRPDVIILGGCVFRGAPDLINGIQHVIDTCSLVPKPTTGLVTSSFGNSGHLVGAAAIWYERFAQPPYTITERPGGEPRVRVAVPSAYSGFGQGPPMQREFQAGS